jgi:hypothetical protein
VETPLSGGAPETWERVGSAFFAVKVFAGPEYALSRILKVGLHAGWMFGFHGGLAVQGPEALLHLIFSLPRQGH